MRQVERKIAHGSRAIGAKTMSRHGRAPPARDQGLCRQPELVRRSSRSLGGGRGAPERVGSEVSRTYRVNCVHDLAVGRAVGALLDLGVVELQQLVEPRQKLVLANEKGCVHHADARHNGWLALRSSKLLPSLFPWIQTHDCTNLSNELMRYSHEGSCQAGPLPKNSIWRTTRGTVADRLHLRHWRPSSPPAYSHQHLHHGRRAGWLPLASPRSLVSGVQSRKSRSAGR